MTLIDPPTTTTRPRKRRGTATNPPGNSSPVERLIRRALTGAWLLGVPVAVAMYVDHQVGAAGGSILTFSFDGSQAGPSVTGVSVLLNVLAVVIALYVLRAILTLGVLPAAAAWFGYLVLDQPWWVGAGLGLVIGGIAFAAVRRQQVR